MWVPGAATRVVARRLLAWRAGAACSFDVRLTPAGPLPMVRGFCCKCEQAGCLASLRNIMVPRKLYGPT